MMRLCIVVCVGAERYAIPCHHIVEVTPGVTLTRLALALPHVAGTFSYRGAVLEVVDLNGLLGAGPSPLRLSSRIVVVGARDGAPALGLLTERVSGTVKLEVGAAAGGARSAVGPALRHDGELVRVLDLDLLLPAMPSVESPVVGAPPP
jgi:chemotaxis signal transduction protein